MTKRRISRSKRDAPPQAIETLRERHKDLDEQRIRAEESVNNSRKRLDELKQRAREQYGTDDLDELKKQLAEMTAENERRRAAYQADLDEIEKQLADVEAKHETAAQESE